MRGRTLAGRLAALVSLTAVLNLFGAVTAEAANPSALESDLARMARSSGAFVGISLIDIGGRSPLTWNYYGSTQFVAASTYKLPVLMYEAQGIASGRLHTWDRLCYRSSDYEPGPFAYYPGQCFTRQTLAWRIGHYSDNTAAHIFIRYMGGSGVLNAYARAHGALASSFFYPNRTIPADLARLWRSEATGAAGGAKAQAWLYPLLTHTLYESGIPAGVPRTLTVAHKVGFLGYYIHDAALVRGGHAGPYVLVIMTRGLGGTAAWRLIARLSYRVWQYENAR